MSLFFGGSQACGISIWALSLSGPEGRTEPQRGWKWLNRSGGKETKRLSDPTRNPAANTVPTRLLKASPLLSKAKHHKGGVFLPGSPDSTRVGIQVSLLKIFFIVRINLLRKVYRPLNQGSLRDRKWGGWMCTRRFDTVAVVKKLFFKIFFANEKRGAQIAA